VNPDFVDFLAALLQAQARFLVVGAHALAMHGVPRATGDMDVWVDRQRDNAERVWSALVEFGTPVDTLGFSFEDLLRPNTVIQIGLPPRRIDILTDVSGVSFEDAWEHRLTHSMNALAIPFMGRQAFIQNKQASGRLKDLADIEALGESGTSPDSFQE
jgi:hypothetical protein